MKYFFTVTETLVKSVVIEAENEKTAYEKGAELYREERIVLLPDDFFDVDFAVRELTEEELAGLKDK